MPISRSCRTSKVFRRWPLKPPGRGRVAASGGEDDKFLFGRLRTTSSPFKVALSYTVFMEAIVSVAHIVPCTEAEGPGKRFALWFQGCPLRCPGCCNPEMLPFEGGESRRVDDL